jgi:hypothetical protein
MTKWNGTSKIDTAEVTMPQELKELDVPIEDSNLQQH